MSELHIRSRPYLGRLESTRFAPWFDHVFRSASEPWVQRKMNRLVADIRPDHVHLVAHNDDFWLGFQAAEKLEIPVTITVHDDFAYNMQRSPRLGLAASRLGTVWRAAARRIVISEPMGREYSRRWGDLGYDVITDSLTEVSDPIALRRDAGASVYFMGCLHLSYHPNFADLIRALERIPVSDRPGLTIRGGGLPGCDEKVVTRVLPWADESAVKQDMKSADFLYLPLPFDPRFEAFVRLSLSTKLVTYLGSGVPILYHGPRQSAVAELIEKHGAALLVTEPGSEPLVRALSARPGKREAVATAAANLARLQFFGPEVRRRFWEFYDRPVVNAPLAGEAIRR